MKTAVNPADIARMVMRLTQGLQTMTSMLIVVTGHEEGNGDGAKGIMRADFQGEFVVDEKYIQCVHDTVQEMVDMIEEVPQQAPIPDDPDDLNTPIRCGFPLDQRREERCSNLLPCDKHPSFFVVPPQTEGH